MYDWHKSHPEKGLRFRMAMESVTKCQYCLDTLKIRPITQIPIALDPGNQLLKDWFSRNIEGSDSSQRAFSDITRFPMQTPHFLAETYPSVLFEVQKFPTDISLFTVEENRSTRGHIYTLNSILWNLPDEDCIAVVRVFQEPLEKSPKSVLLINELMSPPPGTFAPHADRAYRRRDVTVMAMHNAKLRTEKEWRHIFYMASPNFKVCETS